MTAKNKYPLPYYFILTPLSMHDDYSQHPDSSQEQHHLRQRDFPSPANSDYQLSLNQEHHEQHWQRQVLAQFNERKNRHLFFSLIIDLVGMLTFLLPFLGEFADLIYAPFAGLAIFIMYRRTPFLAGVGGFAGFVEEILPGTDIVPTATLMWAYCYKVKGDKTLRDFLKAKKRQQIILQAPGNQPAKVFGVESKDFLVQAKACN